MTRAELFDQLFIRSDIAWPANDRPDCPKIARILNLILQKEGVPPETWWGDFDSQTTGNKVLVFVDFQQTGIEPNFSVLEWEALAQSIAIGLEEWQKAKRVRFNEEMLSFLGVGPASSRRFAPPALASLLKDAPDISTMIPEALLPVLKTYNEFRAAAEHSPFKNQKRKS